MERVRPRPPAERAGFSAPEGIDAVRLQQLAHVTTELGSAETMDAVAQASVTHFAEAIRAAVATLMVRTGQKLVMIAGYGLQPGIAEQWGTFDVADSNPASEAARIGEALLLDDIAEIEERYPSLVGTVPAGRSLVCLPLGAAPHNVGTIGLTFEDGWLPGSRELAFLTTFAEACGQAVRRIRASAEAAERAQQLAFLADASLELASSLDYHVTLARVAQLAVPTLADWCAVQIVQDEQLVTLAVAHVDPSKVQWAWELEERYPPDADAPAGAANVVRTGVSELYEEITDDMLAAGARDEEHLRLSRELDLRSALIVPLNAHGRTLGAITLIRAEVDRHFGPSDLALAEDLGRRAAVSLDNALLHSQTQDVAIQLQRAVLPDALDDLPGWKVAVHYRPGGHADVGGDFYDVIPTADGGLAFFVGDVMGHGVEAAAAMAQMRSAIRAFLSINPDPSDVVSKLDVMFAQLQIGGLVSLLYGVIGAAKDRMRIVNAGHHPPLVIAVDREVRWASAVPQPPLGAGGDRRRATEWSLAADDTVLLYTDGLVERRDEALDTGLARLATHAVTLTDGPARDALSRLVASLHHPANKDDVTALTLQQTTV